MSRNVKTMDMNRSKVSFSFFFQAYFQNEAVRGDWAFHSSLVTYEDPHELAKLIVWSKLLDHLKGYVAYQLEPVCTVKFLNFGTPVIFTVIYLKFKLKGQT